MCNAGVTVRVKERYEKMCYSSPARRGELSGGVRRRYQLQSQTVNNPLVSVRAVNVKLSGLVEKILLKTSTPFRGEILSQLDRFAVGCEGGGRFSGLGFTFN